MYVANSAVNCFGNVVKQNCSCTASLDQLSLLLKSRGWLISSSLKTAVRAKRSNISDSVQPHRVTLCNTLCCIALYAIAPYGFDICCFALLTDALLSATLLSAASLYVMS